jgi:hypothetical protein
MLSPFPLLYCRTQVRLQRLHLSKMPTTQRFTIASSKRKHDVSLAIRWNKSRRNQGKRFDHPRAAAPRPHCGGTIILADRVSIQTPEIV